MDTPALYATAWAVLPPLIAIVLALITKEVYSSLFLGVVVGAVLYAGADFDGIVNHVLQDGIMASLSDGWNVGILIFLVILGMVVALMNLSGGSKAFGGWALKRVRTRVAAEIATVLLGVVIFVDDYFNFIGEIPESHYRKELDAVYNKAQRALGKHGVETEDADFFFFRCRNAGVST